MGSEQSSLPSSDALEDAGADEVSTMTATGAASEPEASGGEGDVVVSDGGLVATSGDRDDGGEPVEFLCPITLSMMGDPVVANDGHSYERAAIATWLETHDSSPQTREPMGSSALVPNHALRGQIAEWRTRRGLPAMPELSLIHI